MHYSHRTKDSIISDINGCLTKISDSLPKKLLLAKKAELLNIEFLCNSLYNSTILTEKASIFVDLSKDKGGIGSKNYPLGFSAFKNSIKKNNNNKYVITGSRKILC